jgi:phage nucleotide-binding protein
MQITKIADLKNDKVSALIYSAPGNGKTSTIGMLKGKTLIIDIDKGTSVLAGKSADISVIRVDNELNDLFAVLKKLNESCPFDNVCIDSLSELEKSMLTILGRTGKNNSVPELQHYQQVMFKMADICRQFRSLPANIIFTAWEQYVEHISPTGEKYTMAKPMLSGKSADTICGLCDVVGRIRFNKEGERVILLTASATEIAKDRINKRTACRPEDLIV